MSIEFSSHTGREPFYRIYITNFYFVFFSHGIWKNVSQRLNSNGFVCRIEFVLNVV